MSKQSKCTCCEQVEKIVFASRLFSNSALLYKVQLCNHCAFKLVGLCFDHAEGPHYDNLLIKFGKLDIEYNKTYATCVQSNGKSNAKTIRKKEGRKIRKHEVEQRTQRNRSNSRKRKKVK